MGSFTLAVILAVIHHTFYAYLANRHTNPFFLQFHNHTIADDEWALTLGSLFASGAAWLLGLTYAGVFVQTFWREVDKRSADPRRRLTLQELDRKLSSRSNPLAGAGLMLTSVALSGLTISLIPTFATPSLTSTVRSVDIPCQPPILDWTQGFGTNVYGDGMPFDSVAIQALVTGSFLPPLTDVCGNCTYNVTFSGPTLQCLNEAPPTSMSKGTGGKYLFYSMTCAITTTSRKFTAGSRPFNLTSVGPIDYTECTLMNATYNASIQQGLSTTISTRIDSLRSYVIDPEGNDASGSTYEAIFDSMCDIVGKNLTVQFTPGGNSYYDDPLIMSSSLMKKTLDFPELTASLSTLIPSLMTNLTLSAIFPNTAMHLQSWFYPRNSQTCLSTQPVYVYNRARLWGVYGAALSISLAWVVFALVAWRENRDTWGDTLDFSRMMYVVSGDEGLTGRTELNSAHASVRSLQDAGRSVVHSQWDTLPSRGGVLGDADGATRGGDHDVEQ